MLVEEMGVFGTPKLISTFPGRVNGDNLCSRSSPLKKEMSKWALNRESETKQTNHVLATAIRRGWLPVMLYVCEGGL